MFSILTSKIFGGLSVGLALTLATVIVWKNAEIGNVQDQLMAAQTVIAEQKVDLATLRGNQKGLEVGLAQCGTSVENYKTFTEQLTNAGVAALSEVQKGTASMNAKLKRIDAMPEATCADALSILKAGAL